MSGEGLLAELCGCCVARGCEKDCGARRSPAVEARHCLGGSPYLAPPLTTVQRKLVTTLCQVTGWGVGRESTDLSGPGRLARAGTTCLSKPGQL